MSVLCAMPMMIEGTAFPTRIWGGVSGVTSS